MHGPTVPLKEHREGGGKWDCCVFIYFPVTLKLAALLHLVVTKSIVADRKATR